MKTFQNNYTTPEQSKILLKLGLPEDSADCALFAPTPNSMYEKEILLYEGTYSKIINHYKEVGSTMSYLPCWSVGRLMEIIIMCDSIIVLPISDKTQPQIDWLIRVLQKNKFNFSKLND